MKSTWETIHFLKKDSLKTLAKHYNLAEMARATGISRDIFKSRCKKHKIYLKRSVAGRPRKWGCRKLAIDKG